jgi:1-acyl-sn-glycerol-3-phosphate acyltransferase
MIKPGSLPLKFKFARFLLFLITRPYLSRITGIQNLPVSGPFLVASNHASIPDSAFLTVYLSRILKRIVHFLAKAEYYSMPILRFFLTAGESIPVMAKEEARSLYVALDYLRHGKIVGIYPEGTRSPDGEIRRGRPGVAYLALSGKVPVVPVGLVNTYKILPRGVIFPRFVRWEMHIGQPLKFDAYYREYDEALGRGDREKTAQIEKEVVKIIMKEIADLSGQEYPF